MYGMLKTSQWCHVSHVCNAVMVSCLPCCHVSNYVTHSITMNDTCLVGWMVTNDTILGGGGGGGEAGFIGPVEVQFATPSMGGALTCCLGVVW